MTGGGMTGGGRAITRRFGHLASDSRAGTTGHCSAGGRRRSSYRAEEVPIGLSWP
jgi:hypothetical protein